MHVVRVRVRDLAYGGIEGCAGPGVMPGDAGRPTFEQGKRSVRFDQLYKAVNVACIPP